MFIFDMDGTLANIDHRRRFVDGTVKPKDWDAFAAGIPNDAPNWGVLNVMKSLASRGFTNIVVTGRNQRSYDDTVNWLSDHGLHIGYDYKAIYMRPDDDYQPDDDLKNQILDQIRDDYNQPSILGVFDDRPSVVKMWRNKGLFVFDCNQSGKDF
jgi:hydroxymethylpyrimidine pyrophosphatase-like HAD family hydrolase